MVLRMSSALVVMGAGYARSGPGARCGIKKSKRMVRRHRQSPNTEASSMHAAAKNAVLVTLLLLCFTPPADAVTSLAGDPGMIGLRLEF